MPERRTEAGARSELVAALPGLIVGVVTASITDLSPPLRLVSVASVIAMYWWFAGRRSIRQTPAPSTDHEDVQVTQDAQDGRPSERRPRWAWTPLTVALLVALVLNVLALILIGGSILMLLFVVAWLLLLAVGLQLAHVSESLRSLLYQATAVSAGAAMAIGAQPIVNDVIRLTQDHIFWYAGWRVALNDVSLSREQLTVRAIFENLGDDTGTFESQLVLTSRGKHYTEPGSSQVLPKVPGRENQAGTIAFMVDPSFSPDDAVLTIGRPDRQQAVMPLGRHGRAVRHEPRPVTVTGRVRIKDDTSYDRHGR